MNHPRFPFFQRRSRQDEWMDDYSIDDERLTDALDQLRLVNRFLGGYAATLAAIRPYLLRHGAHRIVKILDVGSGVGDFAEEIVRWARAQHPPLNVHVTATDLNPATVAYARDALSRRLPVDLRSFVDAQIADALALPYDDDSYDLVLAAMFLHHLPADGIVRALREMNRVAKAGIVVNDLHRHVLAWAGIMLLTNILPAAPMVRHDAPLSVLRGFRRDELLRLASAAGLSSFSIRGAWAFRWVLSTVSDPPRFPPFSPPRSFFVPQCLAREKGVRNPPPFGRELLCSPSLRKEGPGEVFLSRQDRTSPLLPKGEEPKYSFSPLPGEERAWAGEGLGGEGRKRG